MPPRRSARVVLTKKVVEETVQVSVVNEKKKKGKQEIAIDSEETLPSKTITVEDKEEGKHTTVEVPIEEPEPETEPEAEPSSSVQQKRQHQQRKKKKGNPLRLSQRQNMMLLQNNRKIKRKRSPTKLKRQPNKKLVLPMRSRVARREREGGEMKVSERSTRRMCLGF